MGSNEARLTICRGSELSRVDALRHLVAVKYKSDPSQRRASSSHSRRINLDSHDVRVVVWSLLECR